METLLMFLLVLSNYLTGVLFGKEVERKRYEASLEYYQSLVASLEQRNEDQSKHILALRKEIEKTWNARNP